jgi:glycine/sarcosine N-methyltransferase
MSDISVQAFYDDLAATYDQIYPDWAASVARQGAALDALLTRELATAVDVAAADLRALPFADGRFDGLVCADNSLPHLLTSTDVVTAMREMHRVLRSGGAAIVTTRDYDAVLSGPAPSSTPPQRSLDNAGRRVVTVQLWDWSADGTQYVVTHLQATERQPGQWETRARTTIYRAWLRQELLDLAVVAGFRQAGWLTPTEAGFFQPVLVLRS